VLKNANPVSWRKGAQAAALLAMAACARPQAGESASIPPSPASTAVQRYSYDIVRAWPHDPAAFTQGLVYRNGSLLESTGLNGRSTLREVDLETGQPRKQVALSNEYFAEGLAVVGSQAFQLTWQNGKAFVYDVDTFRKEQEFTYSGEGWGLATDGRLLILSDGTSQIRFIDPATFKVTRTISVMRDGKPVDQLNELEFIRGEIFANIWQTDEIVRIDPATGAVRGVIDFAGLLPRIERRPDTDVLNGIAYDPATDRLFITGKRWPKLYEVRLKVVK
jgi:glutamine cyclotransferase